jgi:hypothetical protein
MAGDPAAKLSDRVTERLSSADESSPIEVIVELHPVDVSATGSRQQRIAAVKAGFERELQDVAEKITEAGGQVLETAWLNQTVRSVIPAGRLSQVAETDAVTGIDLPRPLQADADQSS